MCKVLDIKPRLVIKMIKESIHNFDHLTPEEKMILLEEYCKRLERGK